MHDEQTETDAALTELRKQLTDGLARTRLSKTQLATRARRGRTTVQEALQAGGPVPSAETVVALARVLSLPVEQLMELRRTAAGATGPATGKDEGPGKPISEWDPHDLELHPAGSTPSRHESDGPERMLPGYVPRAHDEILAGAVLDAAQDRSRIVVLIGSSSTGKTRACWEAVQPLAAQGWRLWHPFDPTRAHAALNDLEHVRPHTVVWLNEAQHYLGDPRVGEQIAAAIHTLLTHPERRPVLVLGTLWPEYANQYTALPQPGTPDPHSQVRELLAGRTITVPETFNQDALHTAAALAEGGDRLLSDALTRASFHGRVTQDLAGAPELERRYEHGTPTARAVLEAAMDARRLGVGLHLPQAFLIDAAIDYLSDQDYDELTEDWAEAAFADLSHPVHGKQAPLRRTRTRPQRRPPSSPEPTPLLHLRPVPRPVFRLADYLPAAGSALHLRPAAGPVFRLADYLEQHGRSARGALCPPASFWDAARTHLTNPEDLNNLAEAAHSHRLQWAHNLRELAALAGHTGALVLLTTRRLKPSDPVVFGEGSDLSLTAWVDQMAKAQLLFASEALITLAMLHESAGDLDAGETLRQRAGDPAAVRAMDEEIAYAERARTRDSIINNIR
ncbi:helix-turn-helix domain-containing protein [Streptomyces sp. NBC_01210]|uniref:helix-turn-helix domain-containing protein n=1 Tax=Streptomyces sp. NBC_01210 TaxID=2903774 RepID=UPI002E108969|nr:helix-turn-helix domain-containing protein [Streptomyces sp. NBC_01210]